VLADGRARWESVYGQLRAALPEGCGIGRIPGGPVQPSDCVILVDLQHVAATPRASWQLKRKQHMERLCLAVLDEPLMLAGGPGSGLQSAAVDASAAGGSSSSGDAPDVLSAAEQILRDTGFLEPSLDKRLLTLSSRFWESLLQPTGGYAVAVAQMQFVAYQMRMEDAVASGLLHPVCAATVETGVDLTASLSINSSSSTPPPASAAIEEAALSSPTRLEAVASAYRRLCPNARAIAYAAGPAHARALAVALSLRGVPAVPLHQQLPAAEQAAVLSSFAGGQDRVLVTSIPAERLHVGSLPIEALLMAVPTADRAHYAARLAPGMAVRGGSGGDGGSMAAPLSSCLVIDFHDRWAAAAAAAAADEDDGGGKQRTAHALVCQDLLGPLAAAFDPQQQQWAVAAPPQPPAAADPPAGTPKGTGRRGRQPPAEPPTTGVLEWVLLDDGTWAMPLSLTRTSLSSAMTGTAAAAAAASGGGALAAYSAVTGNKQGAVMGSRIIRLRRTSCGLYVPEIEIGGVEVQPLLPGRRRGLKLQAARVR